VASETTRGKVKDNGSSKTSAAGNKRTHLKILKIWSISESPGKRGFPCITISAKIQPTDHISMAVA
jgi:hypothetical protein